MVPGGRKMFNTDDVGSVTDAHIPSIVIRCMSFDLCPKFFICRESEILLANVSTMTVVPNSMFDMHESLYT